MDDVEPVEEFGSYLVYEQLGTGGVATVHRAEARGTSGFRKLVAIKRLLPHLVMMPDIVDAFVREARLASHMQHPNIAQTYELGKVGRTYFIAMEYVPGPTLDQIVRHSQAVAGAIPIPVILGILIQICDALDYAHELRDASGKRFGIIHRDVSPPNVIVSNTGTVKLLDFGIAKVSNERSVNTTGQNVIKGKFHYLAPEYLLGSGLDLRADLFAVGVIAHELLTGRRLFDGATDFDTSAAVINMPIQPPSRWASRVPHELDDIVLTALQRDPAARWQSAAALRTALANTAHETRAVADNAAILEWIKWAFSQKPRPDEAASVANLIDMLESPSSAETVLSPRQRAELDAFATPVHTLPGVGQPSDLMRSSERAKLVRSSKPPIVVAAEPVRPKRSPAADAAAFAATVPMPAIPATRTKAVSHPPAPRSAAGPYPLAPKRHNRGLRVLMYLLLLAIAAGAGVLVAAYLFDIELPFSS